MGGDCDEPVSIGDDRDGPGRACEEADESVRDGVEGPEDPPT